MKILFVKGNVNQKTNNQYKSKNYSCFDVQFNNFFIFQHDLSIYFHNINYTTYPNLIAIVNDAIPNKIFSKNGNSLNLGVLTFNGTMMAAPNQAADKLINKSDNLLENTGSTFYSISQAKWIGALHVVGQCVSGSLSPSEFSENDFEWLASRSLDEGWEDIRIDRIQPGGEFVVSKVNALEEKLTAGFGRDFISNISQQNYNQKQRESNINFNIEVSNINHLFISFLNLKAINNNTITKPAFVVNKLTLAQTLGWGENKVVMNNAKNPADKLTNHSDNIVNQTGSILAIDTSITHEWVKVSQIKPGMEVATLV